MCVCVGELTRLGLVLFVLVDEQETRALGAERQHDALDYSRDEDEAQQERPQVIVAHDCLHSKHLKSTQTHSRYMIHLLSFFTMFLQYQIKATRTNVIYQPVQ